MEKRTKKINYLIRQMDSSRQQEEERAEAWKNKGCQNLYNKLINYAGGFKVVRKGMQGQAKQIAITAHLKEVEPDYTMFKSKVDIANEKRQSTNYKRRRQVK